MLFTDQIEQFAVRVGRRKKISVIEYIVSF